MSGCLPDYAAVGRHWATTSGSRFSSVNGAEFPAEIALSPIDYNREVFVLAAVRNTSEWGGSGSTFSRAESTSRLPD